MASHVILVRHGQSGWNVKGCIQGQQGDGLTEEGQTQARRLAEQLSSDYEDIDLIISSDLTRAKETTAIVAAVLRAPVQFDQRLRECGFGQLEGLSHQQVYSQYGQGLASHLSDRTFEYDFQPFGGECRAQVINRHAALFEELKTNITIRTALLVGHGRSLNNVIMKFWPQTPIIHGNCVYRVVKL